MNLDKVRQRDKKRKAERQGFEASYTERTVEQLKKKRRKHKILHWKCSFGKWRGFSVPIARLVPQPTCCWTFSSQMGTLSSQKCTFMQILNPAN